MIRMEQPYLSTREDTGYRFLGVPTLMRATSEMTNGAFAMISRKGPSSARDRGRPVARVR